MRDPQLPAAIMWRYGVLNNELTCLDGQIENWPSAKLGPKPDDAAQAQILADYQAFLAQPKLPTPLQVKIAAVADPAVRDALNEISKALNP